jgi:DNA-directed RNA polymerase I subunit RPA34.5
MVNPPVKSRGAEANHSTPIYFEFQVDDELPQRTKRMQPEGLRMRYKPFGAIHPSLGEFDAGRSEIYVPDQIVTPPAERHKKRKKAYEGRASLAAQQDSDPMEVEPSQARSESQLVSPESIRPSQHSPSKQAVTEKGSERLEEKKKKRKKKHKDREASST